MIYFTADLHLIHDNILKYCNRPFKDIRTMEFELIRRWNYVVQNDYDEVYVVGDFSMQGPHLREIFKKILRKLKGRKKLVAGNHEIDKLFFYAGDRGIGFEQVVYPYIEVEEFILCHDPTLSIILPDRPFIVGHIHQMWHTLRNCYNCGVDTNNYTPVSIDEIRKHFRENTTIKIKD